ncbi:MAG: TlpA disulfide reductase family protein [Polyangiaceae bacterium]
MRIFLALSVALMSCAKPAPPVVAAPPTPSSHVSIAMAGSGIKADLTGPTFVQLDPASRQLTLFAFRADSLPTPTCDTLSAFKLTSGGLVTLQVPKFSGEGTFFVLGAGFFDQDAKTEKLTMGADTLSATLIDVKAYDSAKETIKAEIRTTALDHQSSASGVVVGTICPPKEEPFMASASSSGSQGKGRSSGGPAAPKLEARAVNGASVSLAALKGKVVVVDFWASWCGPCNSSFPELVILERKYRGRGVVVIGVSLDDDPGPIGPFAAKYGVTFPLVWDQGKRLAQVWGPNAIPSTFVIDRSGAISHRTQGWREGDLEDELRKVL